MPASTAGGPVLLTKCGTLRGADGRSYEDHSAGAIRADLDASVARLGRSVDVLQLHDPDPRTPVESAWETIHALVAAGMACGGGLSSRAGGEAVTQRLILLLVSSRGLLVEVRSGKLPGGLVAGWRFRRETGRAGAQHQKPCKGSDDAVRSMTRSLRRR